jgi:hypothetical protein
MFFVVFVWDLVYIFIVVVGGERRAQSAEACPAIDYRYEDGRFWVSTSWVKLSNLDSPSSSEKRGLILGKEAEKRTYLIEHDVKKQLVASFFFLNEMKS